MQIHADPSKVCPKWFLCLSKKAEGSQVVSGVIRYDSWAFRAFPLKGGRRGALAQCPISQTLAHLEDAGLQTSKDPCFYAHKNETCESPRVFFAVRGSLHSLLDCDCCKACCEFLKFCETCHNQCGLAKLRRFGAVSTKADCMMLYGLLPYRFFRVSLHGACRDWAVGPCLAQSFATGARAFASKVLNPKISQVCRFALQIPWDEVKMVRLKPWTPFLHLFLLGLRWRVLACLLSKCSNGECRVAHQSMYQNIKIQIELQLWSKQCPERENYVAEVFARKGDFLACWLCPRFIFFGIRMDVETCPATRMKWIWVQVLQWINFFGVSNRVRQLPPLATGRSLQKIFGGPFGIGSIANFFGILVRYCHWKVPGDSAQRQTWKHGNPNGSLRIK